MISIKELNNTRGYELKKEKDEELTRPSQKNIS